MSIAARLERPPVVPESDGDPSHGVVCRCPQTPRKSVVLAPFAATVSDFLTIPSLCWRFKKPPAGVHVVVVFNRNVAVHTYPADLGFFGQLGDWEGSGVFARRGT